MFLRFFGLREQPFGTTPDPRLLYMSDSHREALASLIYGIETGRGFMALIAEPGMGKTTLLFQLMERLRNSARTVFLFQTEGNVREFFSALLVDLGLDPGDQDLSRMHRQLNEVLLQEARSGKQFVLIVDEAQNLSDSVLESVRMLSNFETSRRKLLQIVLAGQLPLADKLTKSDLEQLEQRVSIRCRLDPLNENEVAQYIRHRLEWAGYKGGALFGPETLSILAKSSRGIPRNINNLCFHALSLAYAQKKRKIDTKIMAEVLRDLDLDVLRSNPAKPEPRAIETEESQSRLGEVDLRDDAGVSPQASRVRTAAYVPLSSGYSRLRTRQVTGGGSFRWLAWAFTLLAGLFVGEALFVGRPADSAQNLIAQSLSAAVQKVRDFAVEPKPSQAPETGASHPKLANQIPSNNPNEKTTEDSQSSAADAPGSSTSGVENPAKPTNESAVNSSGSGAPPVSASTSAATQSHDDASGTADFPAVQSDSSQHSAKGRVLIESNIEGSSITINGLTKPGWQTPRAISLAPGSYRIAVSEPGYSTWFKEVRITRGANSRIRAYLSSPRSVILIDTRPRGMLVYIDGRAYGPSEVEARLNPGAHTYKVIPASGKRPLVGSFFLRPGAIMSKTITCLPSDQQPDAENHVNAPGHTPILKHGKEGRSS